MLKIYNKILVSKFNSFKLFIHTIIFVLFAGCLTQPQSSAEFAIPQHNWSSQNPLSINLQFNQDSSAPYQLYLTLKHNEEYHFKNIWLKLYCENLALKTQDSSIFELPLAIDQQGWLGTEYNQIIMHKILLNIKPYYFKKGHYKFTIKQMMREDPLQNMMSIGLILKKINRQ